MAENTKFFKLLEYYEAGKWGAEDIKKLRIFITVNVFWNVMPYSLVIKV